ncbi:uncharacterized protein [Oscarella lobularis]|uniref:uncharacterized protein n=1 Tax=Oscarella lobularis TaxID=121494 RepID=UPI003313BF5B
MITVAGIALALVTVAFAAVPTPCTFPDTWSGVIAAEINGRDGVRQDLFDVAYDAANERVAAAASIGLEKNFSAIALFQKKILYVFNTEKEHCVVANLDKAFEKWGIPDDARFKDGFTTGFGDQTIHNENFGKSVAMNHSHVSIGELHPRHFQPHPGPHPPEAHIDWEMSVTATTCFPLKEEALIHVEDRLYDKAYNEYVDIQASVSEDYFTPPSYCPGEANVKMDHPTIAQAKNDLDFSPAIKLF